jgi:Flp pilus assembly pilin Flp
MKRNGKQTGQGLVEYILLVVLIAILVLLVLRLSGVSIKQLFCKAVTSLGGQPAMCSASLFQDDFNNLKKWQVVNGNWKIDDGRLCGSGGEGRIFAPISGASDYVINLNGATMTEGNGYGLYFRDSNVTSVNGYNFQFDPGYGGFIMRKWYNGAEMAPTVVAKPAAGFNYNATHNIQVTVQGSTFTAFVDGQQVFQTSDPSYTSGGIGLRTWDSTQVCFDSISVNPLP